MEKPETQADQGGEPISEERASIPEEEKRNLTKRIAGPYSDEFWPDGCCSSSELVHDCSSSLNEFLEDPYVKGTLFLVAQRNPHQVILRIDGLINQCRNCPSEYKLPSYMEELLEVAALNAAGKSPFVILRDDRFIAKSYGPFVVELAARTAADKDPICALKYFGRYSDQPYADEVLQTAVMKKVGEERFIVAPPNSNLLYYSSLFIDKTYGREVLLSAATKHPDVVCDAIKQGFLSLEHPLTMEVLKKAVTILSRYAPHLVFEYVELFVSYPFAEKALTIAASHVPFAALACYSVYEKQPWASNIKDLAERLSAQIRSEC